MVTAQTMILRDGGSKKPPRDRVCLRGTMNQLVAESRSGSKKER